MIQCDVLGPLECMPDYNRVRAAMYWLRLWIRRSRALRRLDILHQKYTVDCVVSSSVVVTMLSLSLGFLVA